MRLRWESERVYGKMVFGFEVFSDVYDFDAGKPKQANEILSDKLMNELFQQLLLEEKL